ncbi:MAG: tryptophan--tRNA ligase [Myxococcales bacterium]|nr:tryptophan--tRNA ligase [Myxococcales bacterium]
MTIERLRSLSGIKPTGQPHWGNYFGMIRPALELAVDHQAMYFIADYHALTSVKDPKALRQDSLGIAATMLACGLDPAQTLLWRQSDVPQVLELTWVLSCATSLGLLERAHSVKDARSKDKDLNHGVYTYPVLMAADILLYDTDVVPVGRDQRQHLEMARDMATFVNVAWLGHAAGGTVDDNARWDNKSLKLPRALVRAEVAVVPGLDGQKMSKSYGNSIAVFAPAKELKQRVMAIVTDSAPLELPKNPDTCNVFALYKLFATADQLGQLRANYAGGNYGYGHAKLALLALAEAHFAPLRERYQQLIAKPDDLEDILRDGAQRARAIAAPVVDRIRSAVGLPAHPQWPA